MRSDISRASEHRGTDRRRFWRPIIFTLALVGMAPAAIAAASLSVRVDGVGYAKNGVPIRAGAPISVGEAVTIMVTVKNAIVSQPPQLPQTDGLIVSGSGSEPGAHSSTFRFFVTPARAGDIVITGFDIRADDGQILRVAPIKPHVVGR